MYMEKNYRHIFCCYCPSLIDFSFQYAYCSLVGLLQIFVDVVYVVEASNLHIEKAAT